MGDVHGIDKVVSNPRLRNPDTVRDINNLLCVISGFRREIF
jgi:hypothetical protein